MCKQYYETQRERERERERELCFANFYGYVNNTHGPTKEMQMHKFAKKRQSKRTLSIRQDTAFHAFPTFHVFSPVYCSQDPHVLFSQKFSLKLGLTILFTHLKIILLQYFSVFNFQLYPNRPKGSWINKQSHSFPFLISDQNVRSRSLLSKEKRRSCQALQAESSPRLIKVQ